jgi:hypothetical protein
MDPSGLIQAIQEQAWFNVIGFVVVLLIALWKRVRPAVAPRLPPRVQWLPAVILSGLAAFAASWQTGATWDQALSIAIYVAITGGGLAIGLHHSAKRVAGAGAEAEPPA